MKHRLSLLAGALALSLAVSGGETAAHEYSAKTVTISHPWARATPPGAKVGVAYFEIAASKSGGDKLIGARSEIAGRVEIHTHERDGDVLRMKQIEALPVKAGTSVVLKPAGDHIMLMELKRPLVEGDLLKLTLTLEKAGEIEVEATIEPVGAKGPHGMEHQPRHEADHNGHGAHKH